MNIAASGVYNNVQYIKIRGIRPAIVFISGLNSQPEQWSKVIEKLDTNREIWLIAPPRYGKYSFPDIVEDVREFFAKHWLFKPYIIGHSLGGLTALELLRQGQRSRGVMVISSPSFEYSSESFDNKVRAVHKTMHASGPTMDMVVESLFHLIPGMKSILKSASLESYLDAYVDFVDRKVSLKLDAKILKRVKKRIGIYGMKDPGLKVSKGYKPEEYVPTHLEEIADAGHFIQTERPEIIAKLIQERLLKR